MTSQVRRITYTHTDDDYSGGQLTQVNIFAQIFTRILGELLPILTVHIIAVFLGLR